LTEVLLLDKTSFITTRLFLKNLKEDCRYEMTEHYLVLLLTTSHAQCTQHMIGRIW